MSSQCPNEGDVVGDDSTKHEGSFSADITGDGQTEALFISSDREGEDGCHTFLWAEIDGDRYSTPIDPFATGRRSLFEPQIVGAPEINGQSGEEVLINVEAGASTQFAAIFTFMDGSWERMNFEGKGPGPFAGEGGLGDLVAFGGSVGHLDGADCTPSGDVVMSTALPAGSTANAYVVERRFFEPDGADLILVPDLTERTVVKSQDLGKFPELSGSPFGSCD